MTSLVPFPSNPVAVEKVVTSGDLSSLTSVERVNYYLAACQSLSLNPITKPFDYLKENGKLSLYLNSVGASQLRDNRQVSIKIVQREVIEGVYVVTAQAVTPDGRTDEATGAIPLQGLDPKAKANAMMKAETKAKRRVTLSICGLTWQDEDAPIVKSQSYDPPIDVIESGSLPTDIESIASEILEEEDFGKRIAQTNRIARLSKEQISEVASKALNRHIATSKDILTMEECVAVCSAMLEPNF